jgi:hypothetical protein
MHGATHIKVLITVNYVFIYFTVTDILSINYNHYHYSCPVKAL